MADPKWTNPSAFVDVCEALERIAQALDREASIHRCACPHPCEDYFVHPGPCGARTGQSFRDIKVIADAALSRARNEKETG